MRRLNGTEMKALFVLCAVVSVGLLFPLSTRVAGTETSQSISENPLPLDVYIVSLPDVGNYRAINHSMIVEGALRAARISSVSVFLNWGKVIDVNVTTTVHMVSDWETYRMLIEWGKNVIAINTHDEYLPVPSGYPKEEWAGRVADFMLNRWGTWAHTGGYPLYRVWYQNGTREEWGEQGFKTLMKPIGRGNATCYPPAGRDPDDPAIYLAEEYLNFFDTDWWVQIKNYALSIGSIFYYANPGYPIKDDDFKEEMVMDVYSMGPYETGAIVRFAPNQTAFNGGVYVHMSAWKFWGGNGNAVEYPELGMGFISTAVAIWADVGDTTFQVYGTTGDGTPRDRIKAARLEGRTLGLDQAEELLQKAIDAYDAHNYKLAVAYAMNAGLAADKAVQQNQLPQIIAGITLAAVTIGVGAYYKIQSKKKP